MVDDWSSDPPHPRELGFDASYEIPSNIVPEGVLLRDHEQLGLNNAFEGRIVDYRKFASFHMGRPFPDYKRFRTVMAPWDNTPRYKSRAMVHVNTENDAYRLWLTEALIDTKRRYAPDERLVFLHSWNEWCEGTYVEPDGRHGRHLLEETRAAVEELSKIENNGGDGKVAAYLSRIMREKDEGASRSLQAMRQQNMYVYREVEHQREQLAILKQQAAKQELEQAENRAAIRAAEEALRSAEDILQGVLRSKSWRATLPLRALSRLLHRP
jgi:hypothetical protein